MESREESKKDALPGRLLITKLVLENFKSYAGVKEIGPFHKCFSAVVGPNGSGKSNVIDAMLFVFGKRAKKLRLNKVSQLIHNSNEHPNKEFAKVSVHFQNIIDVDETEVKTNDGDNNNYTVVPNSDVVVSRIAFKNNKSEYFVDGKKTTFSKVAELLQYRGIDLNNNRFLILQGEVEQISLMKPKAQTPHEDGLLEYLEDIIGSNKYVEEIEDRSKKIEELSQVRTEKLNRVKVVEKEKDNLEDSKNEALQYMMKERMLCSLKSKEYQVFKSEAVEKQNMLNQKKTELQAKIENIRNNGSTRQAEVDALEAEYQKAQRQKDDLVAELSKCKKEFAAFERKDIKHQEDIKHVVAGMKKLTLKVKRGQTKEEKLRASHAESEKKIPCLEEELKALESLKLTENEKLESMYASLKDKTEPFRMKLEEKQEELAPLTKDKVDCQNQLDLIETEIQIVEKSTTEAKQKVDDAKAERKQAKLQIESLPAEIKSLEQQIGRLKIRGNDESEQLKRMEQDEERLEEIVRNGKSRVESAKASLALASSKGALMQSLEHARLSGSLKDAGLHGRLGDLGSINPKYDVAVSTACGALDYLVTDDTKGAEKCVKYLRDRKLGRATFAILEKFKHLEEQMNKEIRIPRNALRLFDLIKPTEEKYRSAFYFALRNTLVVDTLDDATRIAYQGNKCVWRVVTLKGQLIDKAGTMSGGGKRVKKGGMLLTGETKSKLGSATSGIPVADMTMSKEETQDLEKETYRSSKELKKIRAERKACKSSLAELEKEIEKNETLFEKKKLEIESVKEKLVQAENRIKMYEPKCQLSSDDLEKLRNLKETSNERKSLLEAASKKAKNLEEACAALQDSIMNAGGKPLEKQKSKVEDVSKQCSAKAKALSKARLDCKALLNKADKAKVNLDEAKEELKQLESKKAELQEAFKQIEDGALEVAQAKQNAEVLEKEKSKQVADLKRKYAKIKSEQNKYDKEIVEVENAIESCLDELSKAEQRIATWTLKEKENKSRFDSFLLSGNQLSPENEPKTMDVDSDVDSEDESFNESRKKEENYEQLPVLSLESAKKVDREGLRKEIVLLKQEVDSMKKNINMGSIEEYVKREGEYLDKVKDLEEATSNRDKERNECDALRKKRLDEFMSGFSIITLKLKEMYQMITMGGDAELELVDSLDPFSEGIVFSVRPPKKSWKNISNLSGGEKTLSSLALVFALHHYNPNPLYVMDEIDAALDYKNVSIVANYIKERTKNAQFIIISLRNNMFELADRLVGIYKTENATKSITINPAKIMLKQAKQAEAGTLQDCTNIVK